MERTDADWLALLAAADGPAVADLRSALARGLVKVLAGRGDASAADDFAQDAVMRVLGSLGSFRGESKFLTWALAVATRVAFTELRKARYRDVSLTTEGVPEPAAAAGPTDDGPKEAVLAAVRRLIRTALTDKQRAVVEGALAGHPQAVLMERFGTTRNAFYKLSHDARMSLKRALEAEGVTADEVRAALAAASS
jgi:RNA polymerase sigma-70 factor (ECF subfamily)